MTITVLQLIEQARVRHPAFMRVAFPDGALLLFLNQKQRSTLLTFAEAIEPIVGQARQVAAVVAGALVGIDAGGVPFYVTTSGDGFPVQSDLGVPYIDFTGVPIALDPFGQTGSIPGFPLPTDFIKLIHIVAATVYDAAVRVEVNTERARGASPQRELQVFVSGNRLVPVRQGVAPFSDRWTDVTSLTLSYIAMQTLAALTDVLTIPLVLIAVLEAALAERLAMAVPKEEMSDAIRLTFTADRKEAELVMAAAGESILGDVTTSHVQFNG
jgi:hypothetical protein